MRLGGPAARVLIVTAMIVCAAAFETVRPLQGATADVFVAPGLAAVAFQVPPAVPEGAAATRELSGRPE